MAQTVLGRVLVVDDESDLAEYLQQSLIRQRYAVTATTSVKGALSLLANDTFDLLLTDMLMPQMNGIEFLRQALAIDPQLVGIILVHPINAYFVVC